jgi:hypothetical protein
MTQLSVIRIILSNKVSKFLLTVSILKQRHAFTSVTCMFFCAVAAVIINPANGGITLPPNLVADAWVSMQFEVIFATIDYETQLNSIQ